MDRNENALVEMTDGRWPAFAAEGFAALAQADRLRLILALGDDELSANHLADIVALSPLAVQQHLAVLAFHGFVSSQRYGDRLFYRVSNPLVSQLVLSKLPTPADMRFGRTAGTQREKITADIARTPGCRWATAGPEPSPPTCPEATPGAAGTSSPPAAARCPGRTPSAP